MLRYSWPARSQNPGSWDDLWEASSGEIILAGCKDFWQLGWISVTDLIGWTEPTAENKELQVQTNVNKE